MSATEFMLEFTKRFACSTNVVAGREFDAQAIVRPKGEACAQCGDCERTAGVVGMAREGMEIVNNGWGDVQLRWACPGCGRHIHEDTHTLGAHALAAEIASDPLCFKCRPVAVAA